MHEINDNEINEDEVDEAALTSQSLYVPLVRERARLVPLAFTMPDDVPPVAVDGSTVTWTQEALATFAKMQKEARIKNIPYAWLRGLLEVSLQNVFRIEPNIGLSRYALTNEDQNQPQPFAYLDGGNEDRTKAALQPLLDDWLVNHLIPYARREGVLLTTINQLQELQEGSKLLSIKSFRSQVLPWSWSDQTGTTKQKDRYSFPVLVDYVARRIAGHEIFQGLGPIKRIITSQSGITSGLVELITHPILLAGKGQFSLVIQLEVVTFPSLHQPLLTLNVKKRRWLNTLAQNSFDRKAINGLVFSSNHPDRAFSYQLKRRRNQDKSWQWKLDNDFEVLRRELQLPTQISNAHQIVGGEARTDIYQVMLTYREGIRDRQQEHGIETGVPEIDQIEAFDAIAKILEPIGLKPFDGYSPVKFKREQNHTIDNTASRMIRGSREQRAGSRVLSHTIDNTASRMINAPTLLSAMLQTLETDGSNFMQQYFVGMSDDEIDRLLHRHFQIRLDEIQQKSRTVKFSTKEKDQTSELQALIVKNQAAIQRIYPNERPLLVIFYKDGAQKDLKILEAVIRLLWGDILDIQTNKLPPNTHGPKAGLPGKDLKDVERAEKRREAWEPIAKQIAALNRRTLCLIMADEFYPDPEDSNASKHDDRVNKPSTRQALASIAGSCVQFLLPARRARKTGTIDLIQFFHRVQAAMKDLLWAHSGRIDGVREKVNHWLSVIPLEARPKEILAITVVRKNSGRARRDFGTTFLPIAIRINVETEKCEICCAYDQAGDLRISPWQFFPDALSTVSQISPVRLAEKMDKVKTRFMRFVEQTISASVEVEKNPLVIIDSSNCARLWSWLTDQKIDVANIDIGEHQWMQDTWLGARIIRIRQALAPNIIEDKIQSLVQTFLEDTRQKHLLPADLNLSTPSSQITNLFRLEATNQTGCVAYLSLRHDGTHRKKRGLSCYRETQVARPLKIRKKNKNEWKQVLNKAGDKLHTLEILQPCLDKWSNPNPLEIVVTLRQEGDDPDRLATLVESLRCGFGHYSGWTTLPALLFFERVVRDYISAFALEDDEETELELESED